MFPSICHRETREDALVSPLGAPSFQGRAWPRLAVRAGPAPCGLGPGTQAQSPASAAPTWSRGCCHSFYVPFHRPLSWVCPELRKRPGKQANVPGLQNARAAGTGRAEASPAWTAAAPLPPSSCVRLSLGGHADAPFSGPFPLRTAGFTAALCKAPSDSSVPLAPDH